MKRGDICTAATGSGHGGKPRPVLVIQADAFADTPNVLVALIYTAEGTPDAVRPRLEPDDQNRLISVSDVAVDILMSVPRRKFGYSFGRLGADDQQRVDRALLTLLGFAA